MPIKGPGNFPFTEAGVASASSRSGVYLIFNFQRKIYVGEAADIQISLYAHLRGKSEQSQCISKYGPTGYTFELCEDAARAKRLAELVAELRPACNAVAKKAN